MELGFCFRDPVGIRTQDPQLRRLLLYPAELPDHRFAAAKVRLFFEVWAGFAKKIAKKRLKPHVLAECRDGEDAWPWAVWQAWRGR